MLQKLKSRATVDGIDPLETVHHCVGNLLNDLVFGKVYEENDEVWKWLRHLQEEGVKHIGVAGPLNFLPLLRYSSIPDWRDPSRLSFSMKSICMARDVFFVAVTKGKPHYARWRKNRTVAHPSTIIQLAHRWCDNDSLGVYHANAMFFLLMSSDKHREAILFFLRTLARDKLNWKVKTIDEQIIDC